jgi:hypothetical protein
MADCPECFSEVWPVVGISQRDPVTGRVGWFCESCEALYPDDDYIEMRDRPLGMPHTDGGRKSTDTDDGLRTDGGNDGSERQTALTSHAGRDIAEPVRDDERNVRCPDCDQIVSASKGSHPAPDDAPAEKLWGWECRICENTLPSNALREDAPTFNDRITAVRVAFRDRHERLVPAPMTYVSGGERDAE